MKKSHSRPNLFQNEPKLSHEQPRLAFRRLKSHPSMLMVPLKSRNLRTRIRLACNLTHLRLHNYKIQRNGYRRFIDGDTSQWPLFNVASTQSTVHFDHWAVCNWFFLIYRNSCFHQWNVQCIIFKGQLHWFLFASLGIFSFLNLQTGPFSAFHEHQLFDPRKNGHFWGDHDRDCKSGFTTKC